LLEASRRDRALCVCCYGCCCSLSLSLSLPLSLCVCFVCSVYPCRCSPVRPCILPRAQAGYRGPRRFGGAIRLRDAMRWSSDEIMWWWLDGGEVILCSFWRAAWLWFDGVAPPIACDCGGGGGGGGRNISSRCRPHTSTALYPPRDCAVSGRWLRVCRPPPVAYPQHWEKSTE